MDQATLCAVLFRKRAALDQFWADNPKTKSGLVTRWPGVRVLWLAFLATYRLRSSVPGVLVFPATRQPALTVTNSRAMAEDFMTAQVVLQERRRHREADSLSLLQPNRSVGSSTASEERRRDQEAAASAALVTTTA